MQREVYSRAEFVLRGYRGLTPVTELCFALQRGGTFNEVSESSYSSGFGRCVDLYGRSLSACASSVHHGAVGNDKLVACRRQCLRYYRRRTRLVTGRSYLCTR